MTTSKDLDTFGKRLAYLSKKVAISQHELSNAVKVSQSNLSKYMKDQVTPKANIIAAICDFFNVSADWLVRGIEPLPKLSETIFDPDLKNMVDVLTYLMTQPDERLRHWTIVQFEKAFINEMNELAEKKQNA
jgi:transcriptional regulator with XRE-family HTH domain